MTTQREPTPETAKQKYDKSTAGIPIEDPVEALRFFCSVAMTGHNGQDWLDSEPFFDALKQERNQLRAKLAGVVEQCAKVCKVIADESDPRISTQAARCEATIRALSPVAGKVDAVAHEKLYSRPILYTDSIKGVQVCRDDLWAVTTEEIYSMRNAAPQDAQAEECAHKWIANSGRGGEPDFRMNRQMSPEPLMHVMCKQCSARTWVTAEQWKQERTR
ncbi:MAG: hypothetical protein ACTS6J_02175 [Burkholderiales bacterium]